MTQIRRKYVKTKTQYNKTNITIVQYLNQYGLIVGKKKSTNLTHL